MRHEHLPCHSARLANEVVDVDLASLGITFAPGPLEGHPGVNNPFGLEGVPWVATAGIVILLLLPLCMLASALSLVLRYRHSRGRSENR
jgi:hypothetical protein